MSLMSRLMNWLHPTGLATTATSSSISSFLWLSLLVLAFVGALLVTVSASIWFTRLLEQMSDLFDLPPGLLSLLGALGANIPNYVASLVAGISGQVVVGVSLIIGSNIYNMAIILGISTFASSTRRGIVLTRKEAQDVRIVAGYTLTMMVLTGLAVGLFSQRNISATSLQAPFLVNMLLALLNILTLGLFGVLSFHALRRVPDAHPSEKRPAVLSDQAPTPLALSALLRSATTYAPSPTDAQPNRRSATLRAVGKTVVALIMALGGVIVMVQSAEAFAGEVHLSSAILGLLVLAVATSLPNTVVAFTLARTNRASACIEEVLSSNSVNVALGIAFPLLLWSSTQSDPSFIFLDGLVMVALTLVALLCALRRRVSRTVGFLLVLVYICWIIVHVLI